jgi:hypothetical protein
MTDKAASYPGAGVLDEYTEDGRVPVIDIEQLRSNGNVWRSFRRHPQGLYDVRRVLDEIEQAFNMPHTRVIVRNRPANEPIHPLAH